MRRRKFLTALGAAAVAAQAQTPLVQSVELKSSPPANGIEVKGRFKQSAMLVNFPNMAFEDMCRNAAKIGCEGFDLIPPKDWPTLKKYGLVPTLYFVEGNTFEDGIMHPEMHPALEKLFHAGIDRAAENGCPNIIVRGGERRGISHEESIDRAVTFINLIKAHAEDKGINITLEPVNPADRPDQLFDSLELSATVCKRVNSPRAKLIFDIYHAQRLSGDLTANIRKYYPITAHYHTAGVPGRNEIDETQEINYRFLAKTIAQLGFTGYIAHEFRPSPGRDPVKALEQAFAIMKV